MRKQLHKNRFVAYQAKIIERFLGESFREFHENYVASRYKDRKKSRLRKRRTAYKHTR